MTITVPARSSVKYLTDISSRFLHTVYKNFLFEGNRVFSIAFVL